MACEPIWEGVWSHLDAMDTVCLRTVSMEWNTPEKYGPHGVLLFFLIQKRPVTVPNSEAFNSLIGDGFQVPEWKGESEATKDEQADSSSENKRGSWRAVCHRAEWIWRRGCPFPARLGGGKGSPGLP